MVKQSDATISKRTKKQNLEKSLEFDLSALRKIRGLWTFGSEMFQVDPENGVPGYLVPLYGIEKTQICLPLGRHTVYMLDTGSNVDPEYFKFPHELENFAVVLAVNERGIIEYSENTFKYKVGKRLQV